MNALCAVLPKNGKNFPVFWLLWRTRSRKGGQFVLLFWTQPQPQISVATACATTLRLRPSEMTDCVAPRATVAEPSHILLVCMRLDCGGRKQARCAREQITHTACGVLACACVSGTRSKCRRLGNSACSTCSSCTLCRYRMGCSVQPSALHRAGQDWRTATRCPKRPARRECQSSDCAYA